MKKPTKTPPQIEIRLDGPAVPGRISVDALTHVAKELQTSLRRLLSARQRIRGAFPSEVAQACSLDLTGFTKGSAVLTFEYAGDRDTATLHGDQGVRVAEEMLAALDGGEANRTGWHDQLHRTVLEGFEKLTKPLAEGIDAITFALIEGGKRREVKVTRQLRTNLRSLAGTRVRSGEATVEGVLWECDWKAHTALLDEIDGNRVTLEFSAGLEEQVTALRRQRVRARGTVESEDGHVLRMRVTSIALTTTSVGEPDAKYGGFWDNLSLDELAKRQGVQPVTDLNALAGDWPDGESVDDFLAVIRGVRGG